MVIGFCEESSGKGALLAAPRIVVQTGVGRMERREGCRKKEGGLQT